jgi:hypothetical protein
MEKKLLLFVALTPLSVSGVKYAINDRVPLEYLDAAQLLKCSAVREYTPDDEAADAALAVAAKEDLVAQERANAEAALAAAEELAKAQAEAAEAQRLADEKLLADLASADADTAAKAKAEADALAQQALAKSTGSKKAA